MNPAFAVSPHVVRPSLRRSMALYAAMRWVRTWAAFRLSPFCVSQRLEDAASALRPPLAPLSRPFASGSDDGSLGAAPVALWISANSCVSSQPRSCRPTPTSPPLPTSAVGTQRSTRPTAAPPMRRCPSLPAASISSIGRATPPGRQSKRPTLVLDAAMSPAMSTAGSCLIRRAVRRARRAVRNA